MRINMENVQRAWGMAVAHAWPHGLQDVPPVIWIALRNIGQTTPIPGADPAEVYRAILGDLVAQRIIERADISVEMLAWAMRAANQTSR